MVAKDFIKVLALYDFLKVFSFLSQINSPVKGLTDAPNSGLTRYSGHSSMHGLISLLYCTIKTPD